MFVARLHDEPSASCPVCEKRFVISRSNSMPFCSERCRLVDLGRWLGEKYGLTVESEENESEDPED